MKRRMTMLATTLFLAAPGAAAAQETGYGAADNVSDPGGSGDLPFTGTDTTVLVAAGAGLLLTGFALRRFNHRRHST